MAKSFTGIPTTYKGIKFRSRLEARWAAYFDLRDDGLKWAYEPIDLPGWIPDFMLEIPGIELPALAEVKPVASLAAFMRSIDSTKMAHAILTSAHVFRANTFRGIQILGVKPGCWWTLGKEVGFEQIPEPTEELQKIWIEAGNVVQWKAPR